MIRVIGGTRGERVGKKKGLVPIPDRLTGGHIYKRYQESPTGRRGLAKLTNPSRRKELLWDLALNPATAKTVAGSAGALLIYYLLSYDLLHVFLCIQSS